MQAWKADLSRLDAEAQKVGYKDATHVFVVHDVQLIGTLVKVAGKVAPIGKGPLVDSDTVNGTHNRFVCLAHELGHSLGLEHDKPRQKTAEELMFDNVFLNNTLIRRADVEIIYR